MYRLAFTCFQHSNPFKLAVTFRHRSHVFVLDINHGRGPRMLMLIRTNIQYNSAYQICTPMTVRSPPSHNSLKTSAKITRKPLKHDHGLWGRYLQIFVLARRSVPPVHFSLTHISLAVFMLANTLITHYMAFVFLPPTASLPGCLFLHPESANELKLFSNADQLVQVKGINYIVVYNRGRYFKMYTHNHGQLLSPRDLEA